ncbi:MAG: substrate-binding domain-containing protein [Oscillospiraceae bacterium]|nr:substrate-binding domain-containing protein [Oscillospiraceae bacterium]
MKKLLTIFLSLCLLTGCVYIPAERTDIQKPEAAENTETIETQPFLTLEDYPKMDGSTANLPLMAAVLSAATGMERADAENTVDCTTTPYAWECLARGEADILLVYEAAEDTKALLDEIGTEMEITPIGLDALVFIVNEQNPVQSMTQEELRAVYTGQITNWKELGGEDLDITAFQRVATSGSQSLFMKLLMKDTAPMEAPKEFAPSGMGELIEGLAAYNNEGSALGYSVFYYASYMYAKPGLRFLAVDGVAPSDETIADRTYPLLNPFYVAIRADEPEGSPARQLRDWLLTEEGTQVIAEAGYIPYPQ